MAIAPQSFLFPYWYLCYSEVLLLGHQIETYYKALTYINRDS